MNQTEERGERVRGGTKLRREERRGEERGEGQRRNQTEETQRGERMEERGEEEPDYQSTKNAQIIVSTQLFLLGDCLTIIEIAIKIQ